MDHILKGLPEGWPRDIPLYTGVSEEDVYINTEMNQSRNIFFATEKTIKQVFDYYESTLNMRGFFISNSDLSEDSAYINFENQDHHQVYINANVPDTIPQELNLKGIFVGIMYNIDMPDPTEVF